MNQSIKLIFNRRTIKQYSQTITYAKSKFCKLSFSKEQLLNTKYSKEEDTVEDVLNILKNKEQQLEKFINLSDDERGEYSASLAKRIAKERLSFLYKNILTISLN